MITQTPGMMEFNNKGTILCLFADYSGSLHLHDHFLPHQTSPRHRRRGQSILERTLLCSDHHAVHRLRWACSHNWPAARVNPPTWYAVCTSMGLFGVGDVAEHPGVCFRVRDFHMHDILRDGVRTRGKPLLQAVLDLVPNPATGGWNVPVHCGDMSNHHIGIHSRMGHVAAYLHAWRLHHPPCKSSCVVAMGLLGEQHELCRWRNLCQWVYGSSLAEGIPWLILQQ